MPIFTFFSLFLLFSRYFYFFLSIFTFSSKIEILVVPSDVILIFFFEMKKRIHLSFFELSVL